MASCGTFQKLSPLSLLSHLSSSYDTAHLKVSSGSVSWSIYLEEGKITYASHSIAPFDRLDCHLHRLGHKIPALTSEIRAQLSLIFETDAENQSLPNQEYQAISWLVNHECLTVPEAAELITGLVKEVIESFLLVKTGSYEFGENLDEVPVFCRLNLQPLIDECQQRLQGWRVLGPHVWSPYQRLYFSNRHKIEQQVAPEIQQKLSAILKGFSFRHLAILLNQDEIQLAKSLHQYIVDGTILLQDPYPPFDRLPRTFEQFATDDTPTVEVDENPTLLVSKFDDNIHDRHVATPPRKTYNPNPSVQYPQFSPQTSLSTPPQTPEKIIYPHLTPEPEEELVGEKSKYEFPSPTPHTARDEQAVNPFPAQPADNIVDKPVPKKTYKVVCVDDSPAILRELNRCLEDDIFSVHTINNPVKALMQIIKVKPDLILLDVNMAGIDGYELCRLLRNHSLFKNTPIIMVTANTGLINRVKARIVGASGYLTKPFTQPDLLKIVFRYLS